MNGYHVPSATYRLQLHHGFPFRAAQDLIPYLYDLGISHLYASPFFKARRRSLHGYSVTNPLEINPELGSKAGFRNLERALKTRNMGLLLDIVPNHMALSHDNPWWLDVLEEGPASPYAIFFDIDWHPPHRILEGKVLQPILGLPYGEALENQQIRLTLGAAGFEVRYYDHTFPLDPKTYWLVLSHRLDHLLQTWGEEHPGMASLLGLLKLIEHLPPRSEARKRRILERQRQKEIIKKDLWLLYQTYPVLQEFLDDNVALYNGRQGAQESFNLLDQLLRLQPYRLAHWRVALDWINYRRFFSINDLIGLRIEDPEVFKASHRLLLELIRDGQISGLRIDHIDGLFDPEEYLRRLQAAVAKPERGEETASRDFYVVVEKILAADETLPETWPVAGTTGYDFLDRINGLFVEPWGLQKLEQMYAAVINSRQSLSELVYEKKKLVLKTLFGGEVEALGHQLCLLAEQDRQARDIPRNDLLKALEEIISCLPRYRTYIRNFEVSSQDRACLEQGLAASKTRNSSLNPWAQAFLRRVLRLDCTADCSAELRNDWLRFVMRWQQFTGPVMAKGMEDTTLYIHNPLVSLNEVGSSFQAVSPARFHQFNQDRQSSWPHSLNATSTHDTKRGEDIRMRLNVLSEIPQEWEAAVKRWRAWNRCRLQTVQGQAVPDPNEEYFLYQTLLGAWPLHPEELSGFQERLKAYFIKAAREAKVHTRWIATNPEYENALAAFVEAILDEEGANDFIDDFKKFQATIAFSGALSSLSQVLLKITSPGVPDFYQGTELWDLSLVDPDNRRPVDYQNRRWLLRAITSHEAHEPQSIIPRLLQNWQDGAIKLFVTHKALTFRRAQAALFAKGDYTPIFPEGPCSRNLVAFARRLDKSWVLVAAARFFSALQSPGDSSLAPEIWRGNSLPLPPEAPGKFRNIFTGEKLAAIPSATSRILPVDQLFSSLPVALLFGSGSGT